ncbi:MAG TPA: phage portal protein [Devosia sp.]|nr:phage portal protein [Devosia sp.]
MGLKHWIGRAFGLLDSSPWASFYGGASHSGKAVTIDSALQLSTFWACVRLTAGAIASMPLGLYERKTDGGRQAVADHPLRGILAESPDGERTAFEFWEASVAWLLTTGNAYAEIVRIGNRIVALNLLPADCVAVQRDANGDLRYRFTDRGKAIDLPASSVLHLKGFGFGGDLGLSAIRYGVQTFGSAIAAEEAAGKLLGNGMQPSGVLTSDQKIEKDQREQLQKVMEEYKSTASVGKLMVLGQGLKFEQVSLNPEDGQLLTSRAHSVAEICRWFNLPPVLVGHSGDGVTAWGSGIEQLFLGWLSTGLNTIAIRLEKRIALQLIGPGERARLYAEFNREGLLQADSAAKISFLSGAVQNGLMTRNEGRGKLNLPRVEGGDALTAQTNLAPLDRLGGGSDAAVKTAFSNWLGLEESHAENP